MITTFKIIVAILLLIIVNTIRVVELRENTAMWTWNQYWKYKDGVAYSILISIFLAVLIFL